MHVGPLFFLRFWDKDLMSARLSRTTMMNRESKLKLLLMLLATLLTWLAMCAAFLTQRQDNIVALGCLGSLLVVVGFWLRRAWSKGLCEVVVQWALRS